MNGFRAFLNRTFFLFSPEEQYREVCQGSHERFLLYQGAKQEKKQVKVGSKIFRLGETMKDRFFLVPGVGVMCKPI